jgi:protein phosphatase
MDATPDAFDVLQFVAGKRLKAGKLTVIDATNVRPEARAPLVALAKAHDVLAVAIVLHLPERLCHDRNAGRADRTFGPHVIRNQVSSLRRSLKYLQREGFRKVFVLSSIEDVETASITREPLWNDLRHERGPFDIIGDVHGCADELLILLENLGYVPTGELSFVHPQGRKAVFLGDLVDRGPRVLDTLRIAMNMVAAGSASASPAIMTSNCSRRSRGRESASPMASNSRWLKLRPFQNRLTLRSSSNWQNSSTRSSAITSSTRAGSSSPTPA